MCVAQSLPRVPSRVTLPGSRGFGPCRRPVRQQACAQAALHFQAACDPGSAPSARRGMCVRGRDPGGLRYTGHQAATVLQERDELALGLGIPFDVALRHGEAGLAGAFLHVPQTPPDRGHCARGAGHERPAAGMRRTAVHLA